MIKNVNQVIIMEIKPIGKIENDFDTKFAVPRQSGLVESIKSRIIMLDEYASKSAFKGLEKFSHIWLIWEFDQNQHEATSLTVRPPRLGGNERVGVFASRAPYRPNPLGLSCVKLENIIEENNKTILVVSGADLVNGTQIYDIKPYLTISDLKENAISGYSDEHKDDYIDVSISKKILDTIPKEKQEALLAILKGDPRPAYHNNENRIYGFKYAGYEIKFKVENGILIVLEITNE